MQELMTMSAAGIAMTKRFEGLRLEAYEDCAGVCTIGYGHTGKDVHPGRTITEGEADELLNQDLSAAGSAVCRAVSIALSQSQFDALVDFCFNLGEQRLLSSTLLRYLNAGNFAGAESQFEIWVHAGGKVQPGLVSRRKAEADMFSQR